MEDPKIVAAVKHYEAMRRAQKKYYEKKMDAKGPRKGPGRPKKLVTQKSEDTPTAVGS